MTQHGVAANRACCALTCTMSSAQSAIHDGDARTVVEDELNVVRVGPAAAKVDDEDRLGQAPGPDLQVAVGGPADPGPLTEISTGSPIAACVGDGDDRGLLERRERLGGNAIGGNAGFPEAPVATADGLDAHTGPLSDGDRRVSGRRRRPVVQAAQPLQRVNRHSSSRPPGTSKASTSKELNCSPLLTEMADEPSTASVRFVISRPPFHLQFDQPVEFEGIFHRQLLAIGSTNPRTTIAIASSSVSPRLIR